MEKSFWTQELIQILNSDSNLKYTYAHFEIYLYLFGSAIWSNSPHDLDIVILYNCCERWTVREIRNSTIERIHSLFKGRIDCILLSFSEEEQARFLEKEKAVLVFPTPNKTVNYALSEINVDHIN